MSVDDRQRRARSAHFWAGAVGGTVGITLTCPLEVVKTRAQASTHVSMSVVQSIRSIVRSEGVLSLWRGLGPSIVGVAPARALYFGFYSHIKPMSEQLLLPSGAQHFAASATSGCMVATITSPVWLLKTRMQLQTPVDPVLAAANPSLRNYTSYSDAVARIMREEGVRGFYKGLTASYWGVTEGALQMMLYERFKHLARQRAGTHELPHAQLFGIAAVAKLIAASVTYPLEVVRTRLREQRAPLPGQSTR